jgi:hypothetical protein
MLTLEETQRLLEEPMKPEVRTALSEHLQESTQSSTEESGKRRKYVESNSPSPPHKVKNTALADALRRAGLERKK